MGHEGMSEHQRVSLPSDASFSLYLLFGLEEGRTTRRCFSTSTITVMQAERMHPEEADGDRLLVLNPLSFIGAGRGDFLYSLGNQVVCKKFLQCCLYLFLPFCTGKDDRL